MYSDSHFASVSCITFYLSSPLVITSLKKNSNPSHLPLPFSFSFPFPSPFPSPPLSLSLSLNTGSKDGYLKLWNPSALSLRDLYDDTFFSGWFEVDDRSSLKTAKRQWVVLEEVSL